MSNDNYIDQIDVLKNLKQIKAELDEDIQDLKPPYNWHKLATQLIKKFHPDILNISKEDIAQKLQSELIEFESSGTDKSNELEQVKNVLAIAIHMCLYSSPKNSFWRYVDEPGKNKYQLAIARQPLFSSNSIKENPPGNLEFFQALTDMVVNEGELIIRKNPLEKISDTLLNRDWDSKDFILYQIRYIHNYNPNMAIGWAKYIQENNIKVNKYPNIAKHLESLGEFLTKFNKIEDFAERTQSWIENAPSAYNDSPPYPKNPTDDYINHLSTFLISRHLDILNQITNRKRESASNESKYLNARRKDLTNQLNAEKGVNKKESITQDIELGNIEKYTQSFSELNRYSHCKAVYEHLEEVENEIQDLEESNDPSLNKIQTNLTVQEMGLWIQLFVGTGIIDAPKSVLARGVATNFSSIKTKSISAKKLEDYVRPANFEKGTLKSIFKKIREMQILLGDLENK